MLPHAIIHQMRQPATSKLRVLGKTYNNQRMLLELPVGFSKHI